MRVLRICKHCGLEIIFAEKTSPARGFWYSPVGSRGTVDCRKATWHAPYDVPESLDRETVERWLGEPLVID